MATTADEMSGDGVSGGTTEAVGTVAAPRGWRVLPVTLGLLAAACGSSSSSAAVAPVDEEAPPTSDASDDAVDAEVEVALPAIPAVALPDVSLLGETGDLVGDRLGDLVSPVSGVDVVGASCADEGGELQYTGSSGTDLFAIDDDGSGEYQEESDDGLVSLRVAADGSGEYYDRSRGELVTIKVAPDGSGEYYREERSGKVTVEVATDGSGVYYDDRDDALLTVTLPGDGSGELYSETEQGLLTVEARPDGSGTYYHDPVDGGVVTVEALPDGSWSFTQTTSTTVIELTVADDGSGRYQRSGLREDAFDFDAEGRGPDRTIQLPPTPEFTVAGSFPPLGKLGSLEPPCATVIRFDEQVLFEFNEATLRSDSDEVLDQVAAALEETDRAIEINGHTDSVGSEEYNLELSRRRAEAVETALRQRGLDVDITVNGLGESQPVAPNTDDSGADDPAGRARNRRVEIVIPE